MTDNEIFINGKWHHLGNEFVSHFKRLEQLKTLVCNLKSYNIGYKKYGDLSLLMKAKEIQSQIDKLLSEFEQNNNQIELF